MTFHVRLPASGESFTVAPGETLLDAGLRAGVVLPSDCRQGVCGTCRVRLQEGRVRYAEPPAALAPEEEAAGFALACQAHASSDLALALASPALAEPQRRVASIRALERLAPDVTRLQLELPAPDDYLAGQYMRVHLADGTTRNFSMASAPRGQRTLEFHVRRIPGGRFTATQLDQLRPGDRLDIEFPLGTFFLRRQDYRPLVMLATGTGLAPIRGIVESLLDDPDAPEVALYWGGRTAADLYLQDELRAWSGRLREFRFVPVLSRADASWRGRRGYVQDAVLEDFSDLSARAIYLCGSPRMIAAARRAFAAAGASMAHCYADAFVFQTAGAQALPA